jgi:hypothetical protein
MIHTTKRAVAVLTPLLLIAGMAAQTQRPKLTLVIQGCTVETPIIQMQGRTLMDVQDLARITNGSLSFERDQIILTMPRCDASKTARDDTGKSRFSGTFTKAGIEAMASIREWGGMLMITVQNGYPVGNTMAGNAIMAHQGRAADGIALASSAATTDSDNRGLELLRNEFNNVEAWADTFIKARNSLSAANLTTSEAAVKNDPDIQKLVHCGQFLAQMFADGTFQDNSACH